MIINIFPNDFKEVQLINDFNYTFLKIFDDNIYTPYYNLLNSINTFKLKNIYHFIFLRTIKIHNQFININPLKKIDHIDPFIFNNILNDYIKGNKINAIMIINSIQQYFYPIKNI